MRWRRGVPWVAAVLASATMALTPASPAGAAGGPPLFDDHPVIGPHRVGDGFGHPRVGGRRHEGIDLFSARGTPVAAVWSGQVTDIDVDGGPTDPGADPAAQARAGNALTLHHPSGWSVDYFHLNNDTPGTDDGANRFDQAFTPQLREGAWVLAGQVVGFMGDSGNAEDTPVHLHFELRDPGRVPIDPAPSLRAAGRRAKPRAVAVAARPAGGHWVLDAVGRVHALDGAPFLGEPDFGWGIARDLAVMPDGAGYVVLDGYGGLHRYGSARSALAGMRTPYWPGRDLGRAVAIAPDGAGLVVLDAWGGTHGAGSMATLPPRASGWWPGWDIARDLAVMPDGAGYAVLDGYGGVHAAGTAVAAAGEHRTPYWSGWDMGRALALRAGGLAVLDGWGGIHGRGSLAGVDAGSFRVGSSWADLAVRSGTPTPVVVRHDGLQLAG